MSFRRWIFHWWPPIIRGDRPWKALGGRVIYYGWGIDVQLPFAWPRRYLTIHTRDYRAAWLSPDGTPTHDRAIHLFGAES